MPADSPTPPKAPRITTATETGQLSPDELNVLFVRDGMTAADPQRLAIALGHSLLCITARQLRTRQLAGFVRVYGDGIFHLCACDLAIDPELPNRDTVCNLLFNRLEREVKIRYPNCSLTIFAREIDWPSLQGLGFSNRGNNVEAMLLPAQIALSQP